MLRVGFKAGCMLSRELQYVAEITRREMQDLGGQGQDACLQNPCTRSGAGTLSPKLHAYNWFLLRTEVLLLSSEIGTELLLSLHNLLSPPHFVQ